MSAKLYSIRIATYLTRTIEVKAESVKEAEDKAFEELKSEVNISDNDWRDDCEFEVVSEEETWTDPAKQYE